MATVTADRTLECMGKTITTSIVYDAAVALAEMAVGETLDLLTDDYEPIRNDIEAWCYAVGNDLVHQEMTTVGLRFTIQKGQPTPPKKSLAMVISTDSLEELLSPLGFALAAALEGIDVHLYFQGPGVHVLQRGFRPKLRGWSRPFTRFAAAGLAKSGHVAAREKLRQLRSLGARIYMCGPSMEHFKVKPDELIFDALPQVEYLTFMSVMERSDIHIYN